MKKEQLETYIENGLSSYQIAKITNKSQTSVRYWLKKFNLKTKHKTFEKGTAPSNQNINRIQTSKRKNGTYPNIKTDYDWNKIQEFYNNKKTWRDITKEFNISMLELNFASKNGIFKTRSPQETLKLKEYKNPPMSEEVKNKLSKIRINYLKSNNLHRWHNKSSHHSSWFCESVKNKLKEQNIQFKEEFMPLKHINRFFSLDIAFPELMIAFELNGRQHYDSKNNLLPYYQKRHDLIAENGWKLFEIKYSKDIDSIVEFIKEQINFVNGGSAPLLPGYRPRR